MNEKINGAIVGILLILCIGGIVFASTEISHIDNMGKKKCDKIGYSEYHVLSNSCYDLYIDNGLTIEKTLRL